MENVIICVTTVQIVILFKKKTKHNQAKILFNLVMDLYFKFILIQ